MKTRSIYRPAFRDADVVHTNPFKVGSKVLVKCGAQGWRMGSINSYMCGGYASPKPGRSVEAYYVDLGRPLQIVRNLLLFQTSLPPHIHPTDKPTETQFIVSLAKGTVPCTLLNRVKAFLRIL